MIARIGSEGLRTFYILERFYPDEEIFRLPIFYDLVINLSFI